MEIVIIKHENSGQMYLFKVPQDYALFAGGSDGHSLATADAYVG